jgi:hypothetical protein
MDKNDKVTFLNNMAAKRNAAMGSLEAPARAAAQVLMDMNMKEVALSLLAPLNELDIIHAEFDEAIKSDPQGLMEALITVLSRD